MECRRTLCAAVQIGRARMVLEMLMRSARMELLQVTRDGGEGGRVFASAVC